MSATLTKPSLLEVVLDALDEAYWHRRAEVQGCRDCARNPAGICLDHEADNAAAAEFEEARKRLQRTPDDPEVAALLNGEGEKQ